MIKLKDLLSSLPKYGISGSENIEISGISDDSRKIKSNYLFIAVSGKTFDGHDFIAEAIRNGAKAVVGEKSLKVEDAIYIKAPDSREALGMLASEYFGNPSRKLRVIGVTGTKGKTTTAHLIYHILSELGEKAGLVSSIVAKVGDREIDTGFHVTSPDVLSLHEFLKEMLDAGCKYAVIEVSSHGIDQKRIAGVNFEVGVLTNIAPEHLDYHGTFEEYKRVKMSFINSCKHKVVAPRETDINILPGKFNNLNAHVALEVIKILGFDEKKALAFLYSFKLPQGRLEEIKNNKGFKVFVDFAHTPDSLEAALKYLRTQTSGSLIALFGSAGERDPYKRLKMGKIASELADKVILTAEDPRSERVEDIIDQIRSGITIKKVEIYEEPDRKKAIILALKTAKKGDLVVLLGKGHEKSMNLDGIHEIPWSDQKVVREALKKYRDEI